MQEIESINTQSGLGMRTTDFFDDSTSEDEPAVGTNGDGPDTDLVGRESSNSRKRRSAPTSEPHAISCEGKRASKPLPAEEEYQRLKASSQTQEDGEGEVRFADTPSTSFNGSVDELQPGEEHVTPPQYPRHVRLSSARSHRSSGHVRYASSSCPPMPGLPPDVPVPQLPPRVIAAHSAVFDMTIASIMSMAEQIEDEYQAGFAPIEANRKQSLLPAAIRMHDPRSPREQVTFQTPQSTGGSSKKVHVVPPPIDTSGLRRSLPPNLVRTPYPFTPDRIHRKDLGKSPQSATTPSTPYSPMESNLTLSIRRCNPHAMRRVTTLTIPAPNDFSAVRHEGEKSRDSHFRAIDFDDAEFFRQLQIGYRELIGATRYFSARSLKRIAVSGPATKAADAGYGWLHQPRSPRVLAYRGLSDTFSEEKVFEHYLRPNLGRKRYAFVHWAHRLAAAPPLRTPQLDDDSVQETDQDLVRRMEQPEGLEFVVSWSIARIVLAFALVVMLAIAATLLWIFLGKNTVPSGHKAHGGYGDAGDRVGTGVVLGICLLLFGLSGMAGWLGVSWLVM
jgi:hypothetical protein